MFYTQYFYRQGFFISIIILILLAGGTAWGILWYQQQSQSAQDQEDVVVFTPRPVDDTANWKTYTNTKYGFEFKYPENSTVELRNGYLRIQNYIPKDFGGLSSGEYYLELHLPPAKTSCKNQVLNSRTEKFNSYIVYQGLGEMGGDVGGIRYALCAEKIPNYLYVQVTENSDGILANQILSTFKFMK